jgi:hypothetical protein
MNHLVSFSGGRTSAFMCHFMLENYPREDLTFIYANTGKEHPKTLEFIKKCDDYFELDLKIVEALVLDYDKYKVKHEIAPVCYYSKGVRIPLSAAEFDLFRGIDSDFYEFNPSFFGIDEDHYLTSYKDKIGTSFRLRCYQSLSIDGEPFSNVIAKYGLPNKNAPLCTRELKESPIRKFAQAHFGKNYLMHIGIRVDERIRVNSNRAKRYRFHYPLITDMPTTRNMILDFWKSMPFDLEIPSLLGNCDFCWKKSQNKRIEIIRKHPRVVEWWRSHEDKSDYIFDRDGVSISNLIGLSKEKAPQLDMFFQDNSCSCFANIQFDDIMN